MASADGSNFSITFVDMVTMVKVLSGLCLVGQAQQSFGSYKGGRFCHC